MGVGCSLIKGPIEIIQFEELGPIYITQTFYATVSRVAKVAELADAPDLGSGTERCGGSSPPFRTKQAETWQDLQNLQDSIM